MDLIKLTAISHREPYIKFMDEPGYFSFEAIIYHEGEFFYTKYFLEDVETKDFTEFEWLDESIQEAVNRVVRISTNFEPFEMKILNFDKGYDKQVTQDIYNNWINN